MRPQGAQSVRKDEELTWISRKTKQLQYLTLSIASFLRKGMRHVMSEKGVCSNNRCGVRGVSRCNDKPKCVGHGGLHDW